jgi:hypothetical protein
LRSHPYSVSADRLGNVLELLLAAILEVNVQLAYDFAPHFFGNQDTAWIGDPFQPDSNVDPLAVEVTILLDFGEGGAVDGEAPTAPVVQWVIISPAP